MIDINYTEMNIKNIKSFRRMSESLTFHKMLIFISMTVRFLAGNFQIYIDSYLKYAGMTTIIRVL